MPGTRDTRAHTGTRIAQTPQPSKPTNTPARPRATTESAAGSTVKLNSFVQQPQPRSRTLPKRSPRPTQKRPPPANPRPRTRPGRLPLPERLRPPRTCSLLPCSKAVGETVLSVPLDSTPFAVLNTNNATETRPWLNLTVAEMRKRQIIMFVLNFRSD